MRRRRRLPKHLWLFLVFIGVGVQVWRDQHRAPAHARPAGATKVFEVMPGAQLVEDPDNDGDSFRIRYRDQEHVFRLYFADCPEKRRHAFNGERLQEQGRYFGGLTEYETVFMGEQAQAFTRELLRTQSFTLYTKWQAVFTQERHYTFVVFVDGEDLSEKLVRAGLARIHTTGTTLPDGRQSSLYERQLRQHEAAAKSARRGAWSFRP